MVNPGADAEELTHPLVVRLVSQRGTIDPREIASRMPGTTLDHGDFRFVTDDAEPADVVVVINYSKYDTEFEARAGYVWNWHNEPIVRTPFARGYDRIYTHRTTSGDPRVRHAPPILDWWVEGTYDQLRGKKPPKKTKKLSAIASSKTLIAGHRRRNDFISLIEREFPEVDVFGEGRPRRLANKSEGLLPYEYSIAIENTSTPHYWTEKIVDCFLSYTVPVYFGATNISEYFPDGSVIWLDLEDFDQAAQTIRHVLTEDDWATRLPALTEAREMVLEKYSLYGQISRAIRAEEQAIRQVPRHTVTVHGRRTKPGGWIRGVGLIGNIRARLERRRQRLAR